MSKIEIRTVDINDAEALLGIYGYYVKNTAIRPVQRTDCQYPEKISLSCGSSGG